MTPITFQLNPNNIIKRPAAHARGLQSGLSSILKCEIYVRGSCTIIVEMGPLALGRHGQGGALARTNTATMIPWEDRSLALKFTVN